MTRQDHLMVVAMEECGELAQRISKAMRFGMDEVQADQMLTNRQRILQEYYDLRAMLGLIGIDAWQNDAISKSLEAAKVEKVNRYLAYSESLGLVER